MSLPSRILMHIRNLCVFLSSIALVVLIFIFAWLVFGRYVLNETPTWVEQLALVLVCYIAFLGSAAGVHDGTHLGVTFIREGMPPPIRKVLRIVAESVVSIFGLVMMIASADLMIFGWSTKLPMLNVPESVRTFPAMVLGGLMFVFAGARAIAAIRSEPDDFDSNQPDIDQASGER